MPNPGDGVTAHSCDGWNIITDSGSKWHSGLRPSYNELWSPSPVSYFLLNCFFMIFNWYQWYLFQLVSQILQETDLWSWSTNPLSWNKFVWFSLKTGVFTCASCCKYCLCDTWGNYSNSSNRVALFQAFEFQVCSLVLWAVSVRFDFCVSELWAKKIKLMIIPEFKYVDSWVNPITDACATLRGWKWRETYWIFARRSFFPLFKNRKNLQISWCLWLLIFSIDLYLQKVN